MSRAYWRLTAKQIGREYDSVIVHGNLLGGLISREKNEVSIIYRDPYPFYSVKTFKFTTKDEAKDFCKWVVLTTKT